MINQTVLKEYGWSSIVTFVAAFAVAIAPTVGSLPLDKAAIFALLAAGIRAGTRAVLNLLTTKFNTLSSQ